MSDNDDNSLFDMLYEIADTVIEVKEIDPINVYKKEVFYVAMKSVNSFFNQVNERLNQCENDEEKVFVKETTFNFLLISLRKHIVDFDVSDEGIDILASHLNKHLLALKKGT